MIKFEVGKKYVQISYRKGDPAYEIIAVIQAKNGWDYGVATKAHDGTPFIMNPDGYWKELAPPLTFADLKPGEKFKWTDLDNKPCGPLLMKIFAVGEDGVAHHLYLEGKMTGYFFKPDIKINVVRVP